MTDIGRKVQMHKQPDREPMKPRKRAHVRAASQNHALPPFEVFQLLMGLDPIQGESAAHLSISRLTHCAD